MPFSGVHFLLTAENSAFVRKFDEAALSARRLGKAVDDTVTQSQHAFDRTRAASSRLGGVFSLIGGTLGFGGLALGIKDTTEGAIQLQIAQGQLKTALQATGQAGASSFKQLSDYAEKLSTSGGFATPANIQSLTAFQRETHSTTESTKLLALATDIARGRNMDLASAQMVVQRAYTGSIGRLQQLLGPMVKVSAAEANLSQAHATEAAAAANEASAMGKYGHIWLRQWELTHKISRQELALAVLQDKHATAQMVLTAATQEFSGATANYSKTTSGGIENTRHAIQNLQDSVGTGLLPIFNKVIQVIASFTGFLARNRVILYGLVGAVAAVSGVLITHAAIVAVSDAKNYALIASNRILGTSFKTTATKATEAAGAQTVAAEATTATATAEDAAVAPTTALGLAMDALPILALVTGLVLLATHFKQVKAVATVVFNWLKGAVEDVVNFIGRYWKWFAVGGAFALGGPFLALPVLIATNFNTVKRLVEQFVGAVGRFFAGLWRDIEGGAKAVFHFLTHDTPLGGLIQAGGQLLHGHVGGALGSLVHGLTFGLLQHGGVVRPRSAAYQRPIGTDRLHGWLTEGEGVLNRTAMRLLGEPGLNALNQGNLPTVPVPGGGGGIQIHPSNVYVQLNSRAVAQAVIQWSLQKAARGPSSLAGGSLVTGVAGVIDTLGG